MISATRSWFRRNRTNLAVGVGVVGAGYVVAQYVLSKITEARESMSSDRIAKENLRRRFEQNQEDCTYTVLALLPTATENVLEALAVEKITHDLQQKKAERLARSGSAEAGSSEFSSGPPSMADDDGRSLRSFQSEGYVHASQMAEGRDGAGAGSTAKTKAQLWSELKIASITRSITLIYALALLTLLTRIQLNLLGRRNYLSSVVSLAVHAARPMHSSTISLENHDDDNVDQTYGNDFETNRQYLTFSWWLLHRGWRDIMYKVQAAVKEVFGPLNPREDITLEKLSELTLEVRKKVEGSSDEERKSRRWLIHLLPPRSEEEYVLRESGINTPSSPPPTTSPASDPVPSNPPLDAEAPTFLRRLLDETSDLIDSPTFTSVLTRLLDAGFSTLIDVKCATQAFKGATTNASSPSPSSNQSTSQLTPFTPATSPPTTTISTHNPAQHKTKLANVMATMTREAHAVGASVPNEYLQAMEAERDLEAFAAVVYSSNFEYEAPVEAGGIVAGAKAPAAVGLNRGSDGADGKGTRKAVDGDGGVPSSPSCAAATATGAGKGTKITTNVHDAAATATTTTTTTSTTPASSSAISADAAFESAWGKALVEPE
ncbi:MAG: peroxin [Thelocarpon superellum]|nr:MAG: peroxin [Thelocarpon superellum]